MSRKKTFETCQEPECKEAYYAKGKCRKHYAQARRAKPVVSQAQVDAVVAEATQNG